MLQLETPPAPVPLLRSSAGCIATRKYLFLQCWWAAAVNTLREQNLPEKRSTFWRTQSPCPGSNLITYSKDAIQYCSVSSRQEWGDWGMSEYNFWLCLCMQVQGMSAPQESRLDVETSSPDSSAKDQGVCGFCFTKKSTARLKVTMRREQVRKTSLIRCSGSCALWELKGSSTLI